MKTLILIASSFPYGKGEEFLETELLYLATAFERIIIITHDRESGICRDIPSNTIVNRCGFLCNLFLKPVMCLLLTPIFFLLDLGLFKELRDELYRLRHVYHLRLTLRRFYFLVVTLSSATVFFKYLVRIIKKTNLRKSDNLCLYTYWCNADTYAIAKYKHKIGNCMAITRCHGYDLYFARNAIGYLPLRKYMVDNLSGIFFISTQGKDYFVKQHLVAASSNLFVSKLGTRNAGCMTSKSFDGEFRLVSCSFVNKVKRIWLIIEALALIKNARIYWTHIGGDPLCDSVVKLAEDKLMGLSNISYEFIGYLRNQAIYEYYSTNPVDVFINVSSSEGIPVSIMEACSFGIPIIAMDVGGVSEIVGTSNGVLLPNNSGTQDIADSIMKIMNLDGAAIDDLKNEAICVWKNNYNAENNYRNFVNHLLMLGKLS